MSEKQEPLYYVSSHGGANVIFQRPVKTKKGTSMGFAVCKVCDDVDPAAVCAILNKAEPS